MSPRNPDARRCEATTREGNPCSRGAINLPGSTGRHCFEHDPSPAIASQRKAAKSAGGSKRQARRRQRQSPPTDGLHSVEDALQWLSWLATTAAEDERLDSSRIQALRAIVSDWTKLYEKSVLEDRLEELEAQLQEVRGGA